MSDDDLITVTVRRSDLESAINAIYSAHHEYCISSDMCGCYREAERLREALDAADTTD